MLTESANATPLTYRRIFAFWFPLGVMWLMMAAEQPAMAAVIARLANAEINLAAFGVVFSLSLAVESPAIQMMAAATALADSRPNYLLLLRLMHIMAVSLTALHLLIGLTPAYDLIVSGLLNVPGPVAEAARVPFIVMAPFSAAVGYRRLWQGALIRYGKTWIVPVTMIARIGTIAAVLTVGFTRGDVSGALLASTALSLGTVLAAIAAGILNRRMVWPTLGATGGDGAHTWGSLLRFYTPLALTTVIFLMSQPLVTFGMARGLEPTRSLAVFPVVNAFQFMFGSLALSYQETAIALLKRNQKNKAKLARFTFMLAASVTGFMVLAAVTPVGTWWFGSVSGLNESLLQLVPAPVLILSAVPALLTYKSWYRAQYVIDRRTGVLAQGVVLYTATLFLLVIAGSRVFPFVGVTVATIVLLVAQIAENGYLIARRGSLGETTSRVALAESGDGR